MIPLIRVLFVLLCAVCGYYFQMPWLVALNLPELPWIGAGVGLLIGVLVISIDIFF